jgi:hypothetical protein
MFVSRRSSPPLAALSLVLTLSVWSCAIGIGAREEILAGVVVPIPAGMSRSAEQRAGLLLPGFGAEQVTYRGWLHTDEIVSFYDEEMAARGWRPNAGLIGPGALLAYSRERQSVLIMVSQRETDTILAITVTDIGY